MNGELCNPLQRLKSYGSVLLASMLLTACDSTPRDRQEAVREAGHELDSAARTAAHKLARVGKATASYNEANRARRARPLDPRQQLAMEAKLLGPYNGQINALTPQDLPAAYGQLVRETRTQRATWTDRDWDYARAVYQRLNDQLKQVRMDMPARDEVRVRARQAEFVSLQASRAVKGIDAATRQQPK
jgi:predicted small secreted protein